jgi:hypothetical protein
LKKLKGFEGKKDLEYQLLVQEMILKELLDIARGEAKTMEVEESDDEGGSADGDGDDDGDDDSEDAGDDGDDANDDDGDDGDDDGDDGDEGDEGDDADGVDGDNGDVDFDDDDDGVNDCDEDDDANDDDDKNNGDGVTEGEQHADSDQDSDAGPLILSDNKKRNGDFVGTLNPVVLQQEIDEGRSAKTSDGSDENTLRAGDKIGYYHPLKTVEIWNYIDGNYIMSITEDDEWVEMMGSGGAINKDQQIKLLAKWNTKEETHIPVNRSVRFRTIDTFDVDPSLNGKFTRYNWPTYALMQAVTQAWEEANKK